MRGRLRFTLAAEFSDKLRPNAMYNSMEGIEDRADSIRFLLRCLWRWPTRVGSLTASARILLKCYQLFHRLHLKLGARLT